MTVQVWWQKLHSCQQSMMSQNSPGYFGVSMASSVKTTQLIRQFGGLETAYTTAHETCLGVQNKVFNWEGVAPKCALTVDFHMQVVKSVAETRVVILAIVIVIVGSDRRFRCILGEASVGVRAVVAYSWASHLSTRRFLLLGRCLIILPIIHGQRRFDWLFSVVMLWFRRFRRLWCGQLLIVVGAFIIGRWLPLGLLCY